MSDTFRRFLEGRLQPAVAPPPAAKRSRSDFEIPSGHDISGIYAHQYPRAGPLVTRDTDSANTSYDHYLRMQVLSYGGEPSMAGALGTPQIVNDARVIPMGAPGPHGFAESQPMLTSGQPEIPLPPDASCTLFVEGLPADCTRREVSHIFRPFVGYKDVRLITKESRHPGGDTVVLCFVDFLSPAHAATAMDVLQGYQFDEHDRDLGNIRLQFARNPGARSGGGRRGKH